MKTIARWYVDLLRQDLALGERYFWIKFSTISGRMEHQQIRLSWTNLFIIMTLDSTQYYIIFFDGANCYYKCYITNIFSLEF